MSEEYPFKILRYQHTDNGVLDNKNDVCCDYRVCAGLLNNYENVIADMGTDVDSLEVENKRLQEKLDISLIEWKKVYHSGVLNLMKDYNLNWDSVYEILKEAVESDE